MTSAEYQELNSEISRVRTWPDVERMRDRILTFPDDHYRLTLLRSLAQHSADVDIDVPPSVIGGGREGAAPPASES